MRWQQDATNLEGARWWVVIKRRRAWQLSEPLCSAGGWHWMGPLVSWLGGDGAVIGWRGQFACASQYSQVAP
jgi:hypothetical protein